MRPWPEPLARRPRKTHRPARPRTDPATFVAEVDPAVQVFHSDQYRVPLPPGHRFPMGKYRQLREALLARGLVRPEELVPAQPAPVEELLRVHSTRWVEAVLGGQLSDAEVRRLGFPWSEELAVRSRAAVGGTCAAAERAVEDGVGANLAGGTHHAFADHGEGYCVFNDIAVSIRSLQARGRIERALVIDLDVHQGNGTAAIFAEDPRVYTMSLHGEHNFPFRKQHSTLDVGLPDGTGDEVYLDVLVRHLPHVIAAARPDLVYYQAGVDPLASDTLGRLGLSHDGLHARDAFVFEGVRRAGLPLVLTLGGGYARPLEASVEAHIGTYRALRETFE